MTKELQELETRIKKERSRIFKKRMQEMFDHCSEVYEDISIVELRLIWYLRQFSRLTPQYCMETARYVYRVKLNVENAIEEEKNKGIDKP